MSDPAVALLPALKSAMARRDRAVTTASVTQVREAIHGRGVGSAEPYREFMGAFLESYAADEAAR